MNNRTISRTMLRGAWLIFCSTPKGTLLLKSRWTRTDGLINNKTVHDLKNMNENLDFLHLSFSEFEKHFPVTFKEFNTGNYNQFIDDDVQQQIQRTSSLIMRFFSKTSNP